MVVSGYYRLRRVDFAVATTVGLGDAPGHQTFYASAGDIC